MLDFLSRLLAAILMSLPFLLMGALGVLFPKQLQDRHVEGYGALYERFPFLKWLDPFHSTRNSPTAWVWNKIIGFVGVGMGIVTFAIVLSNQWQALAQSLMNGGTISNSSLPLEGFSHCEDWEAIQSMNDSPRYEIYSLEQLYDVRRHINKEKYPERFALLVQAIQKKEAEQISDPLPPPNSNVEFLPVGPTAPSQPMGCVGGGLCVGAAIIVGAAAGLLWMVCFVHPVVVPNTDGLNRWGGYVGGAMIGTLIGGIGGIFVAAGSKPLKTIAITAVFFGAIMLLLSNLG